MMRSFAKGGCLALALLAHSTAFADKKVQPVVPWGVECESFSDGPRPSLICFGYEPSPRSVLGEDKVGEPELEPLEDAPDPGSANDAPAGTLPSDPAGVLDDTRTQRDERINSELTGGVPNPGAASRSGYTQGLLKSSAVAGLGETRDPLASPVCGKDAQPCFPCENLKKFGGTAADLPLAEVTLPMTRSTPLSTMERENRSLRPGNEYDALYGTFNAMTLLTQSEAAERDRVRTQAQSTNKDLGTCVAITLAEALELLKKNVVRAEQRPSAPVPASNLKLQQRVAHLVDAVAPRTRPALRNAGLYDEPRIPIRGDRFDEIAKRVNGATASNPQARRAQGLVGLAIALGRALDQQGYGAAADAQYQLARGVTDISLGLLPVAGLGKDIYETSLGVSLLDGEPLSLSERGLSVFGILTAGYGDEIAKGLYKLISAVSGSKTAQIVMKHCTNFAAMVGQKIEATQASTASTRTLPTMDNLRHYLQRQEYSSLIDDVGRLRPEAAARLHPIGPVTSERWAKVLTKDGSKLADWNYYSYSINNGAGSFQGRLYRHEPTGRYVLVKTNTSAIKE